MQDISCVYWLANAILIRCFVIRIISLQEISYVQYSLGIPRLGIAIYGKVDFQIVTLVQWS